MDEEHVAVTADSIPLWKLASESGRHAECVLVPIGTDYQLLVLFNGMVATSEVYSTALQARGRAKHLAAVLCARGWSVVAEDANQVSG